jgi:hypothetical protein
MVGKSTDRQVADRQLLVRHPPRTPMMPSMMSVVVIVAFDEECWRDFHGATMVPGPF